MTESAAWDCIYASRRGTERLTKQHGMLLRATVGEGYARRKDMGFLPFFRIKNAPPKVVSNFWGALQYMLDTVNLDSRYAV